MHTQQAARSAWLQLFILGASALLILISVGDILLFTRALPTSGRGMPLEAALILSGVFIALPLGLVNISLGISGLRQERGGVGRAIATTGLITGMLSVLIGLFWLGSLAYLLLGGFQ